MLPLGVELGQRLVECRAADLRQGGEPPHLVGHVARALEVPLRPRRRVRAGKSDDQVERHVAQGPASGLFAVGGEFVRRLQGHVQGPQHLAEMRRHP